MGIAELGYLSESMSREVEGRYRRDKERYDRNTARLIKKRPALVLFEEYDNVVVAGITSNTKMDGIRLSKKDGAVRDSVIKLNYIFTISKEMISKIFFHLNSGKKREVFRELTKKLEGLNRTL